MQYSESNLLVFENFVWAVDSFLMDIKLYHIEWQKKSTWPVTGLWNRGPLKVLNGAKFILDDQEYHLLV